MAYFKEKTMNQYIHFMIIRTLLVTLLLYFIASHVDLFEQIEILVESYERYNLDEILIVGVLLAFWMIFEFILLTKRIALQSKSYERDALIDSLTNVYNRHGFFKQANNLMHSASKSKTSFGIIYLDVVNFKDINDQFGHEVGDIILQGLSQYLESFMDKKDILARLGGDEFVILTTACFDNQEHPYVEHLNHPITIPIEKLSTTKDIYVSYGVACYANDDKDIDDLLSVADHKMYTMKHRSN